MANLYSTFISTGTNVPITGGTTASSAAVYTAPITSTGTATFGNQYVQWGALQGTAQPNQNVQFDMQALLEQQRQYEQQRRLYELQMEQWRQFYMYGQGTFRSRWEEPEKPLQTKELTELVRLRLLEEVPF